MANEKENQSPGSQSTEPPEQQDLLASKNVSWNEMNEVKSKENQDGSATGGGNPPTYTSIIADWFRRYRVQLVIFIVQAIVLIAAMAAFFMVNSNKIAELEQPKTVMLYRPTEPYLTDYKRSEAVEWRLVEEHSQNPFTQFNTTHLRVKDDGVYAISCTMLIEIDIKKKHPSSTTLLIYVNGEKPIYIKKHLSNIFSIQLAIVLKLHQGDMISVEIHPSKFLSKASDASHLSIMQQ